MNVEIITATANPMDVISLAAGVCFGKDNISHDRVRTCFKKNHLSVFEHVSATFKIEGVSRACMAQITRHRHASFGVESQRYCKYDFADPDWYVVPEAFEQPAFVGDLTLKSWYQTQMENDAKAYRNALERGVKPEDARYLLPNAAKTTLVVTMNARELFHVFDMRLDHAAQWEVRNTANVMNNALMDWGGQWVDLLNMYHGVQE